MATVNPAREKACLSEPLEKVDTGREAANARHGTAMSRLSPTIGPKRPVPLQELAEFRANMPRLRRPAAKLLRELRDEGF